MPLTDEARAQALKLARAYLGQDDLNGGWFELGGSSLDAARLVSSLEHDHGWEITLQDLLAASSVTDLLSAPAAPTPAGPEAPGAGSAAVPDAPARTFERAAAPVCGTDVLWPALARLSADERLALAHRLLGDLLSESAQEH